MHYTSAAIIVAGIAAQGAIATGWTDASSYSCPGNTDNQCSDSQQSGYDWSGLEEGDFSSYGSNSFSGFSCGSSYGKRDLLTKREFGSKMVYGGLDDSPSMSCDGSDSMSIDELEVSTTEDTDVDCEYSMPDGSTCVESHSCSSGGSVIKNTQCGGATAVTFKPGQNAPSGCSIGVHSVGFNCGPPSSTVPAYSSTPISTSPASSTPASSYAVPSSSVPASSYGCSGPECSSTPSSPASSSDYTGCAYGQCDSSTAPVSSAVPSSSDYTGCAYGQCNSSTAPVSSAVPSSSYVCTGPLCSNVPSSTGYAVSSSSYVPYPSGSSIPASSYACSGPECSTSPASPESSTSSAPPNYPTPNCPDLLPKCLNTWMYMSGCKSNDDKDCFCGNEEFINNVMGCISAWSQSESDTQAAASYLMGICAAHVPSNPAIITACPSTVTPVPSVPAYPQDSSSPAVTYPPVTSASEGSPVPSGYPSQPPKPAGTPPCTTITFSSDCTVPATYSTGPSQGYTQPGSSYTTKIVTTVTVPQVQFTTATVTVGGVPTSSVTIVAGTPSNAPAETTPPAYGSSAAPVPGTPGTSFGTSYAPGPSASYSPIVPATGEGVKVGSGFAGVVLGAVAALAAL